MQALTPTPIKILEISNPLKLFAIAKEIVATTAINKKDEIIFLAHAYLKENQAEFA